MDQEGKFFFENKGDHWIQHTFLYQNTFKKKESENLLDVRVGRTLLQHVEREHIDSIQWKMLEIDSPTIQLVVNYLQAIDDRTIRTKEMNEQTTIPLNKSTCISLLHKHFLSDKNSEFISWTRLFIFISVYHTLFSGFSKCGHFMVNDPQNPSNLRQDILDSLLKSCAQFTSLNVEKVFQSQRTINNDKDVPLLNDAIVRWDKSQPFTVIFTDSYDPLFVYKKREDIPASLIDAFRSYYRTINTTHNVTTAIKQKFAALVTKYVFANRADRVTISTEEQQLQEFLIDPNQLTHEQFFVRLTSLSTKYFVQKSICSTCFRQYEDKDQQCTNCPDGSVLLRLNVTGKSEDTEDFQRLIAGKLRSKYILTPDNYIKMLLIYLRVQSNIPVLIMGETGMTGLN